MKTWACLEQCMTNHWVLCQSVYLGRPPLSPARKTSLSAMRILLWMLKKKSQKRKTKQPPWSRSFIIHRVRAWKGICFDLVTKTKTKRLSLIAQMTQVGLGVKSNKSLLPSELYVNTGHQAPACSSARPGAQESLGKQKPANSICLHVQTGPGARTNMFHKLWQRQWL